MHRNPFSNGSVALKTIGQLCLAIMLCAAAVPCCHAAAIAPKTDAEAKAQINEATVARQNMQAANDKAQRDKLREKAGEESALLGIRGSSAPTYSDNLAARSSASNAEVQALLDQQRGTSWLYIGLMIGALVVASGMMLYATRRAMAERELLERKGGELRAPEERKASASSRPSNLMKPALRPPVELKPDEQSDFLKQVDELMSKLKD